MRQVVFLWAREAQEEMARVHRASYKLCGHRAGVHYTRWGSVLLSSMYNHTSRRGTYTRYGSTIILRAPCSHSATQPPQAPSTGQHNVQQSLMLLG